MKRTWLACCLLLIGELIWLGDATAALAATVQSVSLHASEGEERLIIELDKPAAYRLYELEAPQRLIVQLEHARLAGATQPPGKGSIVQHVALDQRKDAVRVALSLDGKAKYRMEEQGARLVVHVFHAGSKPESRARAVLKDIVVRDHEGVTEVFLRGEHMDMNSNAYFVNDGRTLIVDFWGAESKLAKEHFSYSSRYLQDITVGAAENRLRLVLNLSAAQGLSHQIESSPGQWVLRLGQAHQAVEQRQRVRTIDFVPDGQSARIIIRTDQPNPVVSVRQKKDFAIVDIAHAGLPDVLERTLDVSSFPGPVRQIDSYRKGDGVRIVARLRDKVRLTSFQSGNVLTLNLAPVALVREGDAGLKYHGDKVSFDFKDIDIRNALKLIAEVSDLNIIMGDDIQGKLTMRLVDVPWDQALDLILAVKGLGKEQQGNVLRIAPLAVLEQERAARIKARTSVQELEPLVTEFIHLGYASVSDIKALIESAAQKQGQSGNDQAAQQGAASSAAAGGEQGLALLSSRGTLLMDERSNVLIVTDTRERVNNIKRLIAELDKPVQQVLIEARIVEATKSFSRDLGIKWGGTYNDAIGAGGQRFSHRVGGALGGGNLVDLPAQGPTGGVLYNLGTLSNVLNVNLELSAAEADQKVKVLSSPRVLTSNMQEARMEQIIEIPFSQTQADGGVLVTTTVMREAKLSLIVTPQITADDKIIMDIEIHKDTPQQNTLNPQGDPLIDKKFLKTKLLVDNGETVVLGGIYSKTVSNTKNAVPGLSKLPILGHLFQKDKKEDSRVELMLFITPTLVTSGGQSVARQPGQL